MTNFTNKVVPQPSGNKSIKQGVIKFFGGSSASNDGQGMFARAQAALEPASTLASAHEMGSAEYLEEIAEIQQLSNSAEFLAAKNEDPGFTLLHYVAMLGHTTLAEAIEASSRDVHFRFARIARYLVQRNHDVYVTDKYGCIPLQLAAAYGNKEMVAVLLEPFDAVVGRKETQRRNDYLNHQDLQIRFTALHGALNHGQHEVAVYLLEQGANPQILDITRNNAFQVAPSLETLQELLRLVVQHEEDVPTPAIAQLMIEVIKQQGEREKKEKELRLKVAATEAAARAATSGSDEGKLDWAKALSNVPNLDYTQRMLFAAFNTLVHKASQGPGSMMEGARDDGGAAAKVQDNGSEVGTIIRRLFKELNVKLKYEDIWEYVRAAVAYNNYKLTKMMLDVICSECSKALSDCNWELTLGPLIACFPEMFDNLIARLQDMTDADVIGFVRSMRLTNFHSMSDNHFMSVAALPYMSTTAAGRSAVSTIGSRGGGARGAAQQGKLLIYQQLVKGLERVNYVVIKAFFEHAHQEVLNDMAQYPIFKDFVSLISKKKTAEGFTDSDSGRNRLLQLLRGVDTAAEFPPAAIAAHPQPLDRYRALSLKLLHKTQSERSMENGMHGSGKAGGTISAAPSGKGSAAPAALSADLAVQTLDVERVLRAAVKARKSMNVDATVKSITSWVDVNSKDRKAVFVTGISTQLLKELATRFPMGCAKLLNLVSRDVVDQLAMLQVRGSLLFRKEELVKCSNVRNHFTWRAPELQQLSDEKGYNEQVVDALADYGIPFECTYMAAVEHDTTMAHLAALIEANFSGAELKELISNGLQLGKIVDMITACAQPPVDVAPGLFKAEPVTDLLKDMLKEKLSFRIVEAILEAGVMNEATVYTNFRPGNPLYNTYPPTLYKPMFTKHFVQLLLTNWRKGVKDAKGNWTLRPWDKKFIDTIFAPNDPLCTALKSAYDNKLKDTQVYIDNSAAVEGWAKKQRQNQELVLSAFVCNRLLLHRWPVFVLMHMLLCLRDVLKAMWRAMGWQWDAVAELQGHSVDARALVIPWQGIADLGEERGMLTGLIDVDVPVRWFGYAAVKAAITVQWQEFGQMLMLMSALAHIIFMSLFGGFLMLLRNVGETEDGEVTAIRSRPSVMVLMVILGLLSLGGLAEEVFQMMTLTWRTWRNYLGNLVDLTSFALFVVLLGMVWASYTYEVILCVGAIEALVLFVRLVFFASMTDSMGSLMRMVIEIIKDMRYFFLLLGMIFGGFAIAFAVLQGPQNSYQTIVFKLFTVLLGDFQSTDLVAMLEDGQWYMARLSVLLMSVYGILALIVLINLLIAIMNDTYDRIKETEEIEVLHNRARLIVDLESLLTPTMRQRLQERLLGRYLHVLIPAEKKITKFMASSQTTGGEWKGRMRQFHEAIKQLVDPQLREIKAKLAEDHTKMNKDLETIRAWVNEQKRVMGGLSPDGDGDGGSGHAGGSGGGSGGAARRTSNNHGR